MTKTWRVRCAEAMFLTLLSLGTLPGDGTWKRAPLTLSATPALKTFSLRQSASSSEQTSFRSADVMSASGVTYPLQTTADGIVVFNVSLNARGQITGIDTLTDIPPLTNAAEQSLRTWKFAPASADGATEASRMLVAFVFRHAVKMSNPPPANPAVASRGQSGFMPVGILSASYAEYPTSTVSAGTVVIDLTVNEDGRVSNVKVVRGMPGGFVPLAVKAARQWKFEPATLNGAPVTSKIAVAFVSSSRALNPF